MTEINFYISDENADRLFVIKDLLGHENLTLNEFARQLIETDIYRLSPERRDKNGHFSNAEHSGTMQQTRDLRTRKEKEQT